jgi:hypothetical protein
MSTPLAPAVSRAGHLRAAIMLIAAALLLGLIGTSGYVAARAHRSSSGFPQSATMEHRFGVRFTRVAVVGDGGLIVLTYVVLDAEKAARFQDDRAHPPVLASEARQLSTRRISVMKQGHTLRPGQTYYLVYENTRGALQAGERATIADGNLRLEHVPVL